MEAVAAGAADVVAAAVGTGRATDVVAAVGLLLRGGVGVSSAVGCPRKYKNSILSHQRTFVCIFGRIL